MARGKCGLNARIQPRNSHGQFAPAREVIYVDSDDSDFSSEEDPMDRVKWLVQSANNDATKKLKRRTSKACTRVDESFEKLFVDIKYGVLQLLEHTKKGDSVQRLRGLFDIAKADARELVIRQAHKSCNVLDDFFELLLVDVKYGVEKLLEEKNKKIKKTKK